MSKMKKIFISYSHKDEYWIERVVRHMKPLQDKGEWNVWYDNDIKAGDDWFSKIENSINEADASILLISVDFLKSEFIRDEEIPSLLQRRKEKKVKVFPLIIRKCDWQKEEWLKPIQTRPKGKPLEDFPGPEMDSILWEFVAEIKEALKEDAKIRIKLNDGIASKQIDFGLLHVRDGKDEVKESGPLLNDELFFKEVDPGSLEMEITVKYRGNLGFQFKCFADFENSGLSFEELKELLEQNGFLDVRIGGGKQARAWFLVEGYETYRTVDGLINNFFYPS